MSIRNEMQRICMSEVRGMPEVVAAAEKAVATRKGLLLCGPPGIGKTMVARRIPTIMPRLSEEQRDELTVIYREARLLLDPDTFPRIPPFRAPHNSISSVALSGVRGELLLASHGVLFLDDLPEFHGVVHRKLSDALHRRPPVLIIASAIPCPCGWNGSEERMCSCKMESVRVHRLRIKTVCDTIGITGFVDMPKVSVASLRKAAPAETSEVIRARITEGRG